MFGNRVVNYAAGVCRIQFLRGRAWARSSPLTSIANSSGLIVTLRAALPAGQPKRPRSRRLAHTHSPLPSHTRALRRVRDRVS